MTVDAVEWRGGHCGEFKIRVHACKCMDCTLGQTEIVAVTL